MRAPAPSEPNSTFPTYQVPQVSAMRGSAPPVQVARAAGGVRAEPLNGAHGVVVAVPTGDGLASSVISGSSCRTSLKSPGNSNLKMQSVTDYCLLNTVTVPNKQRKDRATLTHNNSSKLDDKAANSIHDEPPHYNDKMYTLERMIKLSQRTRQLEREGYILPMLRLCGGGESSLSTGTAGWGTPPSQQATNNNGNSSVLKITLYDSKHFLCLIQEQILVVGVQQILPILITLERRTGTTPIVLKIRTKVQHHKMVNDKANYRDFVMLNIFFTANKSNPNGPPTGQQTATSQSSSGWGQPGGKPPGGASTSTATPTSNTQSNSTQQLASSNSTKQQLEQLTNMREAIFSQDGWGGVSFFLSLFFIIVLMFNVY